GLVHSKTFDVRPWQHWYPGAWHLFRVTQGGELDEACPRCGVAFLDEVGQRQPDPWNHHRPRFDAAMSIHAIFERSPLEHVFEVVDRRLVALALDGHGPRLRHERAGEARRLFLVGAELVIVVVAGDLLPRVGSLISAVAARPDVL